MCNGRLQIPEQQNGSSSKINQGRVLPGKILSGELYQKDIGIKARERAYWKGVCQKNN